MACFGLLVLLAAPAFADSQTDCSVEGACCFPHPPSTVVVRPTPRPGKIVKLDVDAGGLSRPRAKRALGNRLAAIGACGASQVTAHVVIARSGVARVTQLTAVPVLGYDHGAESTTACATAALRATPFPVSSGVTELDVTLSW